MYKEVSIALFGILLLAITIQSRTYRKEDSTDSEDKYGHHYDLLRSLHKPKTRNHKIRLEHHVRQSADDLEQFRQEMLDTHNQYRARHCAQPLTLDDQLNDEAQQYAEYLLSINRLEHDQSSKDGENLYGGSTYPIPMSVENRKSTIFLSSEPQLVHICL